MNAEQFILSIGIILLATRVLGWIFQRIGQPRVVGEMIAGIMLGPSLFGRYFPRAFDHLFPAASLTTLAAVSQLGLLLFIFVVGLEVDLKRVLKQREEIVVISSFSILAPLGLGIVLATLLYQDFSGPHVGFFSFALFMGTAMSITAFPVLARILKERNLGGTEIGTIAISCAAVNDVAAWFLLALLTAMARPAHDWGGLAVTFLWLLAFVAIMLFGARRAAFLLEKVYARSGAGFELFSILVLIMLASSWTTERVGIHALFGAFVAGLVMPKNEQMIAQISEKIEALTLALLLPLFFALAGLRTRIDLLTGKDFWVYTLPILGTAILGKLAGAAIPSRVTGRRWKDSIALGVLMNTRGLVELVVLNAGLELGILTPKLFTMMVIMALVTTFMTTPILAAMGIAAPATPLADVIRRRSNTSVG